MKINREVKTDCMHLIDGYCRALGTFDLEQAISFFGDNCSFIGNTSGLDIKRSPREVFGYFDDWRKKGIGEVRFIVKQIDFQLVGEAILAFGLWDIVVGKHTLPSRFSFLLSSENGKWRIIHKHSSYEKVVYPWES